MGSGDSYARRTVIVGASAITFGCVDGRSDGGQASSESDGDGDSDGNVSNESSDETDDPAIGEVEQMGDLTLTSQAFDDGERIPEQYGYTADNVNPPLEVSNVPEAAESLALIMDDPDAVEPAGKVWDHWVVWNIPPETTTIPEGWAPTEAAEGTNDFGEVGYGGPNPPDREHRYRFKLFALDATLDLPPETDAEALGSAMDGSVIEQTQLTGTYPA